MRFMRPVLQLKRGSSRAGGVALIRASASLANLRVSEDEKVGVRIVQKALEEPARWIASNAGADGAVVLDRIKNGKSAFGFNAAAEDYEDLVKAGIVDPTKVVRIALQNAASIAGLMITTEAMIADKPEKKKDVPTMPHDHDDY